MGGGEGAGSGNPRRGPNPGTEVSEPEQVPALDGDADGVRLVAIRRQHDEGEPRGEQPVDPVEAWRPRRFGEAGARVRHQVAVVERHAALARVLPEFHPVAGPTHTPEIREE